MTVIEMNSVQMMTTVPLFTIPFNLMKMEMNTEMNVTPVLLSTILMIKDSTHCVPVLLAMKTAILLTESVRQTSILIPTTAEDVEMNAELVRNVKKDCVKTKTKAIVPSIPLIVTAMEAVRQTLISIPSTVEDVE